MEGTPVFPVFICFFGIKKPITEVMGEVYFSGRVISSS